MAALVAAARAGRASRAAAGSTATERIARCPSYVNCTSSGAFNPSSGRYPSPSPNPNSDPNPNPTPKQVNIVNVVHINQTAVRFDATAGKEA